MALPVALAFSLQSVLVATALPSVSTRSISLAQASELAEAHSPELIGPRAAIAIARTSVEAAGEWPNPTLSGSVGPDEPTISGTVEQRFPIFGQLGTAVDAAKLGALAEEDALTLRRVQLRAEVRRAYFALAQAEREHDFAAQRLARAQTLADLIRPTLDAGTASELEVEQGALAQARAQQAQQDQELELQRARLALGGVLGDWSESGLSTTDTLLPLPAAPDLPGLLARISQHPEVLLARQRAEAARARAVKEGAAIRLAPALSLTVERLSPCVAGGSGNCQPGQTGASVGFRGGLSFELPVLSQNRGAVHQAQREAEEAEALADAALRRRTAQAGLVHAGLLAALRRSAFLEQQVVPQALRVEQLARVAYEVGHTPLIAVLQAQAEVTDVQSQALATAAAAQAMFADMEEAIGATL